MKFTDGNWLMQPGVKAHYPAQAYEIVGGDGALSVCATTRHIRHRGDTLQGPLLTIDLSSPLPDIVRVRVTHDTGTRRRGPHFETTPGDAAAVSEDNAAATLTTGNLSARISKSDWRLEFLAGERVVTSSAPRGIGYIERGDEAFVHEGLSLGVGECVYGLGERFSAFVKNGQAVEMWNRDGGTGSDQAYKNVPFYLTNRGYGVFVNHPEAVSFEVATEKVSRVQFSVPGQSLEYFVIYGPTPKEVLEKYTALTGRPALPPPWSFGLWLTTSFTTSYDEKTVTGFLQGMEDRDLPLSVFHFDCFWMREFRWCDFQWDERVFPDPAGMLRRLKERGLKICVWINPYIAQRSPLFTEGAERGYLLRRENGDVWQWDLWQPGMGIVDFTNPDARAWYTDYLGKLLDQGVDCFKTDFGERIPTDVIWHDSSDPQKMHNYYSYLYNRTVFDLLRERRGENEAVLFARSATAGAQQFPVHWGGDCHSTFESMSESLRGGLSLGLSGFGYWSHDIGGFEGTPPADVYKRWIAFGILSSHSRLHGSGSYRVPWLFDEEAVDVLRDFTKLKHRLMPYLYEQARIASRTGVPMMRAMLLEFPDDPACDTLDRQYLLGDSLLVAPVFTADGTVDYYIPAGRWTDWFTGESLDGPCWRRETHGFSRLPLLVCPNTLLPVGSRDDKPDYDYTDGVTLRVYSMDDGADLTVTVPGVGGGSDSDRVFHASRRGREVRVRAVGPLLPWKVMPVGMGSVERVEGGRAVEDGVIEVLGEDIRIILGG